MGIGLRGFGCRGCGVAGVGVVGQLRSYGGWQVADTEGVQGGIVCLL